MPNSFAMVRQLTLRMIYTSSQPSSGCASGAARSRRRKSAAIADRAHQAVHGKRFAINGVFHPAFRCGRSCFPRWRAHRPSHRRTGNAPELRDAVGLPVHPDRRRQMVAERPRLVSIRSMLTGPPAGKKSLPLPKGEQPTAVFSVPIGTGESFVERTVTACRIDAQGLLPAGPAGRPHSQAPGRDLRGW